jgi:hypothetical protein
MANLKIKPQVTSYLNLLIRKLEHMFEPREARAT